MTNRKTAKNTLCQIDYSIVALERLLKERILILDGAMGTEIQNKQLSEKDFRGTIWPDHSALLKGNNDLLSLSQSAIIQGIHRRYMEAGADIIETNTFSATSIALQEYGLEDISRQLNEAAASCAVAARQSYWTDVDERPIWIAGALGPTPKSASISSDVNDPGARTVTFSELSESYRTATCGLLAGHVDILLIETIFDVLNGKAAIFGARQAMNDMDRKVPILISFTLTDLAGRTLSGQTADAAVVVLEHADALAMGMNCALGPKELNGYVGDLARRIPYPLLVYPNAGLPNALGGYDETPERFAYWISRWAEAGQVNIVGGCCGTTPEHIAAVREATLGHRPRKIPPASHALHLAGMTASELAIPQLPDQSPTSPR